MNVSIVVLSCDIYSVFWDWFFACKKRYWKDCRYPTYLVTETKTCKYCQTININYTSVAWCGISVKIEYSTDISLLHDEIRLVEFSLNPSEP